VIKMEIKKMKTKREKEERKGEGWKEKLLFLILLIFIIKSQPIEVFGYEVEPLELRPVGQCMTGCSAPIYTNWISYILVISIIVFTIIATVFMFGRLTNRPDFEALAKLELWQTANALIWIFIIIVPFVSIVCISSCYAAKGNPFEISQEYIGNLKEKIEKNIINLIREAKDIRIVGSISFLVPRSRNCFEGVCISFFAGCAAMADNYETLAFLLYPFLGSLVVQQLALITFPMVFSIIMPVGLILRIIPRFREAGAFLIAVALAIFVVFPLTYVFAKKATSLALSQIPDFDYNKDITCTFLGYGGSGFKNFVMYMYEIGKILPQAVFFPTLSIIITVASARAMSKIFLYDFIGG
jgi:hypothetical protein